MKISNLVCLFVIFSLFINYSFSLESTISIEGSDDALVCEACTLVLEFSEKYLAENKTEEEVVKGLDDFCKILNSESCDLIVNNYASLIVKLLINNEQPSAICTMLELCPKSNTIKIPITNNDPVSCTICKYVTEKVESFFVSNTTESEIISFLSNECNALSSDNWVITCQNLVETYIPILLTTLENKETPAVLCGQLNFCESSSSSSAQEEIFLNVDSEVECPLCTYVASYAEQLIASNKTEEEIVGFLQNECGKLMKKFSTECSAMVADYIPDIITMINNNFTPAQICQKIGLCPAPTNSPQAVPLPQVDSEVECPLCTYVASYAEQLIASNKTEEEIVGFLQNECGKLMKKFSTECSDMVADYIPDIITMINNNFTPSQICQKIGLCPAPTNSPQALPLPSFDLNTDIECPLCTYVASYAEQLFESNKTETEIISFIQKECTKLPAKYSDMCVAMARNYIPEIVTMLENNWTPAQICQKFKLCVAPSNQVNDLQDDCQVCVVLGNYAIQMNYKNATSTEIYNNLIAMCKGLPKNWNYPCFEVMNQRGHQLVDDIIKGYSSGSTCSNIGCCGGSSNSGSSSGYSSGFSSGGFSGSSGLMKFN
ncbi:hypothetical protein DICPUDRAFT_155998 [Dictyostelium purpureum]|uniref:Saposin B-type domain-containing protein n=1 Tax=Dictyostelium purpureum TaxID=5786 RepID=F0ZVF5_DICPU|nr:uncharacterized protein DICPUDRAFT_155998 [Dictyostelium purpureum]EGC32070.1 hypothetical protein DICPUDRAFT_155998 [Dictyostelium purpureum]|eukprot:XP_003291393.1 hypothetical protein DICPUDRAFT_155998 [Dictyostelium purpureum]